MVLGTLGKFLFGENGRPPSPRPEMLPPPISLADARIRSAIGHIDNRSDLVVAHEKLSDTVKYVYDRGLRVGGIFQTINDGSSGHIEVIGNIRGEERLMGWISMNRNGDSSAQFEFRAAHGTLARYRSQELMDCRGAMYSHGNSSTRSTSWRLPSLHEVLEITESANFKVVGISQDRCGNQAHISLHLGDDGAFGRGEITAERGERGIVYNLVASIGPRPPTVVDDAE